MGLGSCASSSTLLLAPTALVAVTSPLSAVPLHTTSFSVARYGPQEMLNKVTIGSEIELTGFGNFRELGDEFKMILWLPGLRGLSS